MSATRLLLASALISALSACVVSSCVMMIGCCAARAALGPAPEWPHRSMDDQYRAAVHEAGHVIGGCALQPDLKFKEVWVSVYRNPNSSIVGLTVPQDGTDQRKDSVDAITIWWLGGGAAEKAVYGTDPELDSIDSDTMDDRLIAVCSKGDACGECPEESKIGGTCMLNGIVLKEHARQFDRAEALMAANKETVVALANLIMLQPMKDHRRSLDGAQLREFLSTHAIVAPKDLPDLRLDVCK